MKKILVLVALLTFCLAIQAQKLLPLKISPDGHYLQTSDGKPFFYLGDTAWELFHRLDREEALHYLKNRADKGFNVIQAVALAELDGVDTPNAYGHKPLIDRNPAHPDCKEGENDDYWDNVDFIISNANSDFFFISCSSQNCS